MSWSLNPMSWFGGYTVQSSSAIESILKPQGANHFFGPKAYAEHNLGKILDGTIPPIPHELVECLTKPSPFPIDMNRPIGENHLLIYIPGNMDPNPNQPTLQASNFPASTTSLKDYYACYSGPTALPPRWFLVPLNAQPEYGTTPNPSLTFPSPESGMQYSINGSSAVITYIALEILKLRNTAIKFLNVPGSDYLENQIWSLQKIST